MPLSEPVSAVMQRSLDAGAPSPLHSGSFSLPCANPVSVSANHPLPLPHPPKSDNSSLPLVDNPCYPSLHKTHIRKKEERPQPFTTPPHSCPKNWQHDPAEKQHSFTPQQKRVANYEGKYHSFPPPGKTSPQKTNHLYNNSEPHPSSQSGAHLPVLVGAVCEPPAQRPRPTNLAVGGNSPTVQPTFL